MFDPKQSKQDVNRLARLTLAHKHGEQVYEHDALEGVIGALTWGDELNQDLKLPGADAVTAADTLAGLRLLVAGRADLDTGERVLIEAAKDRGVTWDALGGVLGVSGQAVQQRYRRLGGTKSWPTPPPHRRRRAEPNADTQPAIVTVTYSVRTADDDGWREVGRTPDIEAVPVLTAVADQRVTVNAAEWGIEPEADVKVAVLDHTGKQIDAFTTKALGGDVCGDPSVSGGCVRPRGHTDGHCMYPILDDPGATPIEELLARGRQSGKPTAGPGRQRPWLTSGRSRPAGPARGDTQAGQRPN